MEKKDYYKILGVSPTASNEEIRKAFLKKNLENHPDRLGINESSEVWKIANEYIQLLNEAYSTLLDSTLRNKYDEDYRRNIFKQDSSVKPEKKPANCENKFTRKTPITFDYYKVSSELKTKIKNRQETDHLFKIKKKGVISSYLGVLILLIWFPILYSLSDSSKWKDESTFIYYIISVAISIIIFRLIIFIKKWYNSEIKWNLLVTPLYFIITEFEKITYYFLWDLKDIKATSHYKNGVYQNTTADLFFDNLKYNITFSSDDEYRIFVSMINNLVNKALNHQNKQEINYFIENDDLLYIENSNCTFNQKEKDVDKILYSIPILISVLITSIFFFYNYHISSTPHEVPIPNSYQDSYNNINSGKEYSDFNENELSLPPNGTVKYYTYEPPLAPLQIITRSNSNYYVKLENVITGRIILSVFIRSYENVNIDVPLGSYIMKYATGYKWYGEKYLFGPNTSYSKADQVFNFSIINNQYSGYTVELYLQNNGNLRTQDISPKDF